MAFPILLRTSSLVKSLYEMSRRRLKLLISTVCIFRSISAVNVHVSQEYKKYGHDQGAQQSDLWYSHHLVNQHLLCRCCEPHGLLMQLLLRLNQSINQLSFYSSNIPSVSHTKWHSSQIDEAAFMTSTGHRACRCLWGKGQVKRICLETLPNSWSGWMDRLGGSSKEKGRVSEMLFLCIGLDCRDRQSDSFIWSQWTGWERWGKHWVKINKLFFMKSFVGQQTDLE